MISGENASHAIPWHLNGFIEVDQVSAWAQCGGVAGAVKRQTGCFCRLASRIIEVDGRCGGPLGDLTKSKVDAAWLLLNDTAEIPH